MLAVQAASPVQEPTSIIFLNSSKVLLSKEFESAIYEKIMVLFNRKKREQFTMLEVWIAESHFFDKSAIAHLEELIKKCALRVFIVFVSDWEGENVTVQDFRERVFDRCSFAQLIIDKATFITKTDPVTTSVITCSKEDQMVIWLRENRCRLNIENYVIFDRFESNLIDRFPANFINIFYMLSQSHVEKAHRVMSQPSNLLDIERVALSAVKPPLPPKNPKVDDELPKLDVEKADPTTPPSSIIFLDVDGVLIDEENPNRHAAIAEKAKELFERNKQPKDKFTQLEMAIAASHFFSCTSVANLEDLIERRQKTMRVFIVIISEWRIGLTIEELRKQVFARCSFSKLIIDKTPDNHFIRSSANPDEKDPAVISKEKYNFDLSSRARQADFWLRENRQLYNIYSHVILDNYNDEFSERFPKNFIQVLFPLSKSNVDEADQIMSKVLVKL